jgi:hypothetical protein
VISSITALSIKHTIVSIMTLSISIKNDILQGSHNKQQQTFFIQQSNRKKVGKFSFANRLNDIVPLLSDAWFDESEKQMKKTLKTLILETVPAKCDI